MATETTPFDAAKYLTTPEAQADFLRDALETGDAGYIAHALSAIARACGDEGAPKADLSPAEIRKRQKAVDFSRASVKLEGFAPSAAYEIEAARYVSGEIDIAELTRRTHEIAKKIKRRAGSA